MKKFHIGFGFMVLTIVYVVLIRLFVPGFVDLEPSKKLLNPILIPALLFLIITIYFKVAFIVEQLKKQRKLQKEVRESLKS